MRRTVSVPRAGIGAGHRPITSSVRRSCERSGTDDVAGIERRAGGPGQQRRVEHEVRLVDERHAGALGGQQPLERAGRVEAAEATAGDHDLPGHRDRIGCTPMNDSLYAKALAPFLAETERLRPPTCEVIDAHTHLGLDEDGRSLTLEQLLGQLDDGRGAARVRVPAARPRAPARLQRAQRPRPRLGRRKRRAAGPVLPPGPVRRPARRGRAHASRQARAASSCTPARRTSPSTAASWTASSSSPKKRGVPILIHAGRGLPPLADGLADLALRHPGTVADPRARRDLRPGHPHHAAGRPPGRSSTTSPASSRST